MKRLKASLSKKLKGNEGESLAEVLIALLIAALALTMLASVISSAARIITQSKKTMSDYYAANGELTTRSHAEANNALTGSGELTVNVLLKDAEDKYNSANLISSTESLDVTYYFNKVVSIRNADGNNSSVVAFWLKPPTTTP